MLRVIRNGGRRLSALGDAHWAHAAGGLGGAGALAPGMGAADVLFAPFTCAELEARVVAQVGAEGLHWRCNWAAVLHWNGAGRETHAMSHDPTSCCRELHVMLKSVWLGVEGPGGDAARLLRSPRR